MANGGASNLSRFARTAPTWTSQVRSWWNPASIEWQPKATTGSDYYAVNAASYPSLLPITNTGVQFTIAAWIKPTTTYPLGVFSISDGSPQPIIGVSIEQSAVTGGVPKITVQENYVANHVSGAISASSWNHIMVSVNDLNCSVFINGVFASSIALSAPPMMATYTQFRVGQDGGQVFEGAFSDIAIFNGVFGDLIEAEALYNDGAAFNLSQTSITPQNPMQPLMTAVWDGSDSGTTTSIMSAKSSIGNPANVFASLDWTGTALNAPSLNPDLRPAAKSNTYSRLASLAQEWAGGTPIDNISALGVGAPMFEYAPSLLPFPFAGWGFKTTASSIIGEQTSPLATPILTVSDSLQDPKMTSNPTVGTGTLQGALDTRPATVLKPTFAVK